MGLSNLSPEELAAWVAKSCTAQGVPVKVTDPAVLRQMGELLGGQASGSGVRRARASTRTAG
jgi:hypothetical protein